MILEERLKKNLNQKEKEKEKKYICEWKQKFHTALVVEFLMFVQDFCAVIECPWTEDGTAKTHISVILNSYSFKAYGVHSFIVF